MASATDAAVSMLASNVPLWITDDRWWEWHAWLPDTPMGDDGESRTACGQVWHWSGTLQTTYHVLAAVSCEACYQVQIGNPQPRGRGRPKRLPQGPLAKHAPRLDADLPTKLRDPDVFKRPSREEREAQEREAHNTRLRLAGGKTRTYTRADGQEVTVIQTNRAIKAAVVADESGLDFTFEVGTRLAVVHCIECGQVLAEGDRYCSRWCHAEGYRREREDRFERQGKIMARRQFLDMLYGRPRRDTIKSWTPPVKQMRGRHPVDSA